MTPDRLRKIRNLFEAAIASAPEARMAFLERACHQDPDLLDEVRRLLVAHERTQTFISKPILPHGRFAMPTPFYSMEGRRSDRSLLR